MLRKFSYFSLFSLFFACNNDGKPNWFSAAGYHVSKDKVWFKSVDGISYRTYIVEGADSKTFQARELVSKRSGEKLEFGFDQQQVFFGVDKLEGADPASFEYLFANYAKDRHVVYYMAQQITEDVKHFVQVSFNFAKDSLHVYYGAEVFSDDPTHFTRVGDETSNFFKDSKKCWYNTSELTNADPATLRFLGFDFAADKQKVFYEMDEIVGADQKTMRALALGYAKDIHHVYQKAEVIAQADPATFRLLTDDYSLDALHCFCGGKWIEGANPSTFKIVDPYYSKDDKQVFLGSLLIQGADPATFRVLNSSAGCSCDAHAAYALDKPIKGVDPSKFVAGKKCISCSTTNINFE
jgi:hypothetical protein